MNIQLDYDEILIYVRKKFHIGPTIKMEDNKTLCITYKIGIFVPTINVYLHVDAISKDALTLSYKCSDIANGLLKGVIGFIREKIPIHQVEISTEKKQVIVYLNTFKELDQVFKIVEPTDINFNHDAIVLNMTLI